MEYTLRGGPLKKGDKILIHTKIGAAGRYDPWLREEVVIVDYLIPCFGKIIVTSTDPIERWKTKCLYYNQENFVWDRI